MKVILSSIGLQRYIKMQKIKTLQIYKGQNDENWTDNFEDELNEINDN